MRKYSSPRLIAIVLCVLLLFCGCDPIYPPGKLKVTAKESIAVGETMDLQIQYPHIGGSIVFDWKEQSITVIDGKECVEVSGLSVTGVKKGVVTLQINATTVISEESKKSGFEEKVYSTQTTFTVI